jgi:hypothetical protein
MEKEMYRPDMSCEGKSDISNIVPVTLCLPVINFSVMMILMTDWLILAISRGYDDGDDGREEAVSRPSSRSRADPGVPV